MLLNAYGGLDGRDSGAEAADVRVLSTSPCGKELAREALALAIHIDRADKSRASSLPLVPARWSLVQNAFENFIDEPAANGDQDHIRAQAAPFIAIVTRQVLQ